MSSTNGSRKRPASAQQHEFTSQKSQRIDIGQSPDDGFVTASDQAARIPKQHSTKWNTGQRARHKHRPGKPQVKATVGNDNTSSDSKCASSSASPVNKKASEASEVFEKENGNSALEDLRMTAQAAISAAAHYKDVFDAAHHMLGHEIIPYMRSLETFIEDVDAQYQSITATKLVVPSDMPPKPDMTQLDGLHPIVPEEATFTALDSTVMCATNLREDSTAIEQLHAQIAQLTAEKHYAELLNAKAQADLAAAERQLRKAWAEYAPIDNLTISADLATEED